MLSKKKINCLAEVKGQLLSFKGFLLKRDEQHDDQMVITG
jgi:hypothetical protein